MIKNLNFLVCLLSFLFLASCGDSTNSGKQIPQVPLNSRVGWTPELIDVLIACQPYPGEVCECVIPQVTIKYTPEQVKEKSPYVAADMLAIKGDCSLSDNTSSPKMEPVKSEPTTGPTPPVTPNL